MIILVSGKQRSGKDFLCGLIEELTNGKMKRVGLADALKDEYSEVAGGLPRSIIEELKMIPQIRAQLILVGQARKIYGSVDKKTEGSVNYWLDVFKDQDNILVADTRYTCEVDYFKPLNAVKIRIDCPREIRAQRGTLSNEDHPSETELDTYKDWDYMIDGSKSKDEVNKQIQNILKEIKVI
jgi:phosphomevalonate kinase